MSKRIPMRGTRGMMVRVGLFASMSLLMLANISYGQSDHDYEKACRDEVARRLNVRHRDVDAKVGSGHHTKDIRWNIEGSDPRRGECRVNRDLKVVDFTQSYGGGGGYSGNSNRSDYDFQRACTDEVARRLNVNRRDVEAHVGGGGRSRTVRWNIEGRDPRHGSCEVDQSLRVTNFDQQGWGGGGFGTGHSYGGGGRGGPGRLTWRGRVDNRAEICIRGNRSWTRTLEGAPTTGETYNMSNSMPNDNVRVNVRKRDGRGKVRLIESPNSSNRYTARIEVEDDKGGADNYEIEVEWN